MKKTGNRFLAMLLTVLLLFSMFPFAVTAAEIVDSGSCGVNVTWTLDSDGTLTISGIGDMYDCSNGSSPFYSNLDILSVVIENGVTSIGDSAFNECTELTSVTIGNSVTSIGDAAFVGCTGLSEIIVSSANAIYHSQGNCLIETASKTLILGCKSSVIPQDGSVTSIGMDAFSYCTGLTSVTIPNSVTSIGDYAFFYTGLTSVMIPDSVTSFGDSAFFECTELTSVTIGNSVTSIGRLAFAYCTRLTSVTLPNSVMSIDTWAFNGCNLLTDVYYSGSEAQWSMIEIGIGNESLLNANIHYNDQVFYEKAYIADIWLNRRSDTNETPEHELLSDILKYTSISTQIVDQLQQDAGFQKALGYWKGLGAVFDASGTVKDLTTGMRAMYESIIFDLLEKAFEEDEYQHVILKSLEMLDKATDAVSPYTKAFSDIVSLIGDGAETMYNLEMILKNPSNGLNLEKLLKLDAIRYYCDKIGESKVLSGLELFIKETNTIQEFFELLAGYQMAVNMAAEMKTFLSTMKSVANNEYLIAALDSVIRAVDNTDWAAFVCTVRFTEDTAINVAEALIKYVVNSNPMLAVYNLGYRAGVLFSNIMLNTEDLIDAYEECFATKNFIEAAKQAIELLAKKYEASGSEIDAGAYVYAMRIYKYVYIMDLDASLKFVKESTHEGMEVRYIEAKKTLYNRLFKGNQDYKTTYESMLENVESIKQNLTTMFDYLLQTWKYNKGYLFTDYPDIFSIYMKEELSNRVYAPSITSAYLDKNGNRVLYFTSMDNYEDKNGLIHKLYGTLTFSKIMAKESTNGIETEKEIDYRTGEQKMYFANTTQFSFFPKSYSLSAKSVLGGETYFSPETMVTINNPLSAVALQLLKEGNTYYIGITDNTNRYYNNIRYHIYRSEELGNYKEIECIQRDVNSLSGTIYRDFSTKKGTAYTYKVISEMYFSNGISLYSGESKKLSYVDRDVINNSNVRIKQATVRKNIVPTGYSLLSFANVSANASEKITLEWDRIENANGYEIYRLSEYGNIYRKIATVGEETLEYTDTTAYIGMEYDYMLIPFYLNTNDVPLYVTGEISSARLNSKEIKRYLPGDVDNDGKVTTKDARFALRAAISLENYLPGSAEYVACDVDYDGKVSTSDARLILRAAIGLDTLALV